MHSSIVRTAAESFFSRSARSSGVAFRRRCVDFASQFGRQCERVSTGQEVVLTHRAIQDRSHPAEDCLSFLLPWTCTEVLLFQKAAGSRTLRACAPDPNDAGTMILLMARRGRWPPAPRQ